MAAALLKNAVISSELVLPSCQDTGTATIIGLKGEGVMTGVDDEEWLARGVADAYATGNLRFSQVTPISMLEDEDTRTNLPAQIDLTAAASDGPGGSEYRFLFIAKGGGSANKTSFFQETRALLREEALDSFLREKIRSLGTAACPPYHLAVVVGGSSAEQNLKYLKLATAGALDALPAARPGTVSRPRVGGPRHGPCAAVRAGGAVRRNAPGAGCARHPPGPARCERARFRGGLLLRAQKCPCIRGRARRLAGGLRSGPVAVSSRARCRSCPGPRMPPRESTWTSRSGPCARSFPLTHRGRSSCCRDRWWWRGTRRTRGSPALLAETGTLPPWLREHPVYYAGPAQTPPGHVIGSFGPTTAQRMDPYVRSFMAAGGSLVMMAKGNRSAQVVAACREFGGFFLGTIGGAGALIARENIVSDEVLAWPELGMEAVRRIRVRDLPAFIVIDDKGGSLYR